MRVSRRTSISGREGGDKKTENGCRVSGGETTTAADAIGGKAMFGGVAKIVSCDLPGQIPGGKYGAASSSAVPSWAGD